MALSLSSPWMLTSLILWSDFAVSQSFVLCSMLGILDRVEAVGVGTLGSGFAADMAEVVTTGPMIHRRLVLI